MRLELAHRAGALYDAALALVYPQPCAVCGRGVEARRDGAACAGCWARARLLGSDDLVCWKCGAPAPRAVVLAEDRESVRCRRCDRETFDAARACGAYEGALRASVLQLKREPHVPERLALLLAGALLRVPLDRSTVVVPVPLHALRLRERGFNQAAALGRALAVKARLPFDEWSLVRTLHTERHRAGMDAAARRESVEAAFEVRRPRLIEGESILLVDDVFTTGATASACASVLKAAGAREVFVLTAARAV